MNLNDNVRMKLTNEGIAVLEAADVGVHANEEGVLETKLWTVMQVFGPHIYHGMTQQFFAYNDIEPVDGQEHDYGALKM